MKMRVIKFPIDGTFDDILKFLKKEGFNKYSKSSEYKNRTEAFNAFNDKGVLFLLRDTIWFADTSIKKISKDNPVFYINTSTNNFSIFYTNEMGKMVDIIKNDKEAFLREINKRFNWQ